jgi:hypothetical protein
VHRFCTTLRSFSCSVLRFRALSRRDGFGLSAGMIGLFSFFKTYIQSFTNGWGLSCNYMELLRF